MNRIALFGAAGAIGQSIARAVSAEGAPYRVVGRSREALVGLSARTRSPRHLESGRFCVRARRRQPGSTRLSTSSASTTGSSSCIRA